ncbi:hypothetical protein T439DRAFT_322962 [Meredithblackwellia eburnea MCA 4105]
MCSSSFVGGALAFTCGSSIGFVTGSINHYVQLSRSALTAITDFDALMRFHIRSNYSDQVEQLRTPEGWAQWKLEAFGPRPHLSQTCWWRCFTDGDSAKRSMAMASTYSAAAAISRCKEMQEDALVEVYSQQSQGFETEAKA